MVGFVQAGFPSPEEEALCDIMSMDEYLITKPDESFLLQVSGDLMIGERIMEGDLVCLVIVERGRQPKTGDVVIAEVDGEKGLLKPFQHFIETTDWEERYLCNQWIDKMCLCGIVVSIIYFAPILLASLLK